MERFDHPVYYNSHHMDYVSPPSLTIFTISIMTRKKVKLAFIQNDSARKATYKKRKKGLMKKVSELSTLCGIDACAIVYSPYDSQPEVWPDARGTQCLLAQFKRMPEMEQSKKMVNQESFIRGRIVKAGDQLKKLHKDNREKEIANIMYQCLTGKALQGLSMPDLNDMAWLIDRNMKEIDKRIEVLKKETAATAAAVLPALQTTNNVVEEQKQWFADWIGNPSDHNPHQFGGGHAGEEMMMGFNDGNNPAPMWPNVFFP